jgi:hypothetical protein
LLLIINQLENAGFTHTTELNNTLTFILLWLKNKEMG